MEIKELGQLIADTIAGELILVVGRVITIYKGSVSFTGFDISGGTASLSTTRGLNEGGAVWIYGEGVLQNCNIHGASSLKGGGVFLSNFEADKVARLNSCRVYDCKTVGDGKDALGGGVYMKDGTSVHNCKVENNEASYAGGGIYFIFMRKGGKCSAF